MSDRRRVHAFRALAHDHDVLLTPAGLGRGIIAVHRHVGKGRFGQVRNSERRELSH